MKTSEKLWWSRYILALAISPLSAYICFAGLFEGWSSYVAFAIAVIAYLLSYVFAKYVFKVKRESLKKPRDIAVQGAFAFFVAWFAFWIFFYTMMSWAAGLI
ncbi:MAG: hypothetical protein ACXQTQ_03835 [Candidatus Hecatellaceae archaeon]|nr:MAG: hypothetical protein DRO43_01415 [Candidatus Hecatellales archaeon]